jgi:hypothetical protein
MQTISVIRPVASLTNLNRKYPTFNKNERVLRQGDYFPHALVAKIPQPKRQHL